MGTILGVSWTRRYLRRMYTDKAVIKRYTEIVAEDGTTEVAVDPVVVAEYPCRISFSQQDTPDNSQADISPKVLGVKLFFDIDADIRKGDVVEASKLDETGKVMQVITGNAALPSQYVNHIEVNLLDTGAA